MKVSFSQRRFELFACCSFQVSILDQGLFRIVKLLCIKNLLFEKHVNGIKLQVEFSLNKLELNIELFQRFNIFVNRIFEQSSIFVAEGAFQINSAVQALEGRQKISDFVSAWLFVYTENR